MKGFRSIGAAQRFLAAFSGISPHFRPRRHLLTADGYRTEMITRFAIWDQTTGIADLPATAWNSDNAAARHAPSRANTTITRST